MSDEWYRRILHLGCLRNYGQLTHVVVTATFIATRDRKSAGTDGYTGIGMQSRNTSRSKLRFADSIGNHVGIETFT